MDLYDPRNPAIDIPLTVVYLLIEELIGFTPESRNKII